jgi:hypothetical protein
VIDSIVSVLGFVTDYALCAQVERGIRGLEPSVVTSFPTVKLGDGRRGQLRYFPRHLLPSFTTCHLYAYTMIQLHMFVRWNSQSTTI